MSNDTVREFYAGIETGHDLNPRLRFFLEAYRQQRRRAGGPVSVLDIGCGREAVLARHMESGDRYTGCDIVPPAVDVPDFVAVDLNNQRLRDALPDRRFDVVFCGEVIEHVFSPDDLLDDLRGVLADDGLLILSTPNLAYWLNRLLLLVGISPMFLENSSREKLGRRFRFLGQGNGTEGHIRMFTYRAMLDLIRREGLHLERVESVPVWNFPLDRLVCRMSHSLAPVNVYLLRDR